MATLLRVDGSTEPFDIGTDDQLRVLQEAVGGYIEIVYAPDGKLLIIDEEGKLKGKPVNTLATLMWQHPSDVLVGDVVLAEPGEVD